MKKSERPNPGQIEKIKLNFYFNTAFRNERSLRVNNILVALLFAY